MSTFYTLFKIWPSPKQPLCGTEMDKQKFGFFIFKPKINRSSLQHLVSRLYKRRCRLHFIYDLKGVYAHILYCLGSRSVVGSAVFSVATVVVPPEVGEYVSRETNGVGDGGVSSSSSILAGSGFGSSWVPSWQMVGYDAFPLLPPLDPYPDLPLLPAPHVFS